MRNALIDGSLPDRPSGPDAGPVDQDAGPGGRAGNARRDGSAVDYWQKRANLWALHAAKLAEALRNPDDTDQATLALVAYGDALRLNDGQADGS